VYFGDLSVESNLKGLNKSGLPRHPILAIILVLHEDLISLTMASIELASIMWIQIEPINKYTSN